MAQDPEFNSNPGRSPDDNPTVFLPPEARRHPETDAGDRKIGPRIPGYEVIRLLGKGGMGTVYQARDQRLNRSVALKVVSGGDEEHTRSLLQEARAQARIDHPHVCKVFEAGEIDGTPYIAMQYLDGQPLNAAAKGLSRDARVRLMVAVVEAVHAAHREGLVHRDLKPANILVVSGPEGQPWPYVVDFGLAQDQRGIRHTQVGTILGTPAYMAPEQARGDLQAIDRRTDVYALGATLYELLVGHLPFEGSGVAHTLSQVLEEEPPSPRVHDPSLAGDLESVVLACLEKDPRRRYDSAKALAEDLRAFLDGDPIKARKATILGRLWRKARRHRTVAVLVAVALASLGVAGGVALRARRQAAAAGELGRSLGTQLARAESALRFGHMMPVHPIEREARLLEEMKTDLAARLPRTQGLSRATLHLALGQILVVQRMWTAARKELEAARNLGLRDAKLNAALAETYLELYLDAQYEHAVSKQGEERAREDKKSRQDLFEPALALVGPMEPSRLRMRLAFAQGNASEGESLKLESLAQEPWLYEVHLDLARIHYQNAMTCQAEHRFPEAQASLDKAWDELASAKLMAPSDPEIPRESVNLASRARDIRYLQALPPDPEWTRRGEEAMDLLGKLLPRDDRVRLAKAKQEVERLMDLQDRRPVSEAEFEIPRLVLASLLSHPKHGLEAAFLAATVRELQIQIRRGRGEPIEALARDMAQMMETALKEAPEHPDFLLRLGMAQRHLAGIESDAGRDGRAALDKSIATFRRALARSPNHFEAKVNLGTSFIGRAHAALRWGGDPGPFLREARDLLEPLQQRQSSDVDLGTALAQLAMAEAMRDRKEGKDPARLLDAVRVRIRWLKSKKAEPLAIRSLEEDLKVFTDKSA